MRTGIVVIYSLLALFFLNLLVSWFSPEYRKQVSSFVESTRESNASVGTIPVGFQDGRTSLISSPLISPAVTTAAKNSTGANTLPAPIPGGEASSLVLPSTFAKMFSIYNFTLDKKPSRVTQTIARLIPSSIYRSENGVIVTVFGANYQVVKDKLPSAIGELYTTNETLLGGLRIFFINPVNTEEQDSVRFVTSFDGRALLIEAPKELYYSEIKPALQTNAKK